MRATYVHCRASRSAILAMTRGGIRWRLTHPAQLAAYTWRRAFKRSTGTPRLSNFRRAHVRPTTSSA